MCMSVKFIQDSSLTSQTPMINMFESYSASQFRYLEMVFTVQMLYRFHIKTYNAADTKSHPNSEAFILQTLKHRKPVECDIKVYFEELEFPT